MFFLKKKNKFKNVIIIPARKGSKSIKNKNMKILWGKPLIYWTIKLALKSKLGIVCVSTDSTKIRKFSLTLGAQVPFLRPKQIAEDNSSTESVIEHALNFYKKKNIFFQNFILLQPTAPLRNISDIINAWKLFIKKKASSVVSVHEAVANINPYWMLKIKKRKVERFVGGSLLSLPTRRQDLPKVYIRNDYVYISKVLNIFSKNPNLYGNKVFLLISKKSRVDVDLNSYKDWKIAECVNK